MRLDTALFVGAVRRVATISSEQTRAVELSIASGRMTLNVRNMDAGQAVEELEIDYDGEPLETGYNARYIQDVTAQIGGEIVEFRLAEPGPDGASRDPILVVDPVDAGVQYVLVPLRV